MALRSAGLLMYRAAGAVPEVLLVHPGGPFWARKDPGAWSLPKGLVNDGEEPLVAACREFREETGFAAEGRFVELGAFRQPGGKMVLAWAVEGDLDAGAVQSNLFTLEWPPRSGSVREFPEVDRAEWFRPELAREKILKGQAPILAAFLERWPGISGETT